MGTRLFALGLLLATACDEEGDGPDSPHCIEVRMRWLEADYRRKLALDEGDSATARARALNQDLIVSAHTRCFPGFMLR